MAERKQRTQAETEQVKVRKEEQARRSRRRGRQWLGVAVSILILVGIFTIVRSGIDMVTNLTDNTAEKTLYEERIQFVVWLNLPAFDDISQVDQNQIRQICIWGAIRQVGYDGLEKDENESVILPALEVERYAAELFGPNFTFTEHATFTDVLQGLTYEYLPERDVFLVPPTSLDPSYVPTVKSITNEAGGVRRVLVGYAPTRSGDGTPLLNPDTEHPARYYDYMFQRDGNDYYLYAIKDPNTQDASGGVVDSLPASEVESAIVDSSALPDSGADSNTDSSLASQPEDGSVASGADSASSA